MFKSVNGFPVFADLTDKDPVQIAKDRVTLALKELIFAHKMQAAAMLADDRFEELNCVVLEIQYLQDVIVDIG